VAIASWAQRRQNERLLTGGEGDNKRRRHSGNYSEFGKITRADITEKSHSLYQSFVVWFSGLLALEFATALIVSNRTPSVGEGLGRLLWLIIGGIAVGLVVGKFVDLLERVGRP
jgi:hypothetical protein